MAPVVVVSVGYTWVCSDFATTWHQREAHTAAAMVIGDMHVAKFLVESCARNNMACGSWRGHGGCVCTTCVVYRSNWRVNKGGERRRQWSLGVLVAVHHWVLQIQVQLTLVTPSFPIQKMTTHLASHIFRGTKRQRRETWHRNTFFPRNFVPTNEGKEVRKYSASYKWKINRRKDEMDLTLTYAWRQGRLNHGERHPTPEKRRCLSKTSRLTKFSCNVVRGGHRKTYRAWPCTAMQLYATAVRSRANFRGNHTVCTVVTCLTRQTHCKIQSKQNSKLA